MLIGHKKQVEFLKKSAESSKISHAYLFSGESELGKKTAAFDFLSRVFKEDVAKKPHPDFIFVAPEQGQIKISQIRNLVNRVSLKPFSGTFKAAVLDQAHLMNPQAQNAFLKTLEEPPGSAVLILITEFPEMILPTIISRCETIKFYPVKKAEIENYLKSNFKISEQDTREISKASMGRPGSALNFIQNPEKLSIQNNLIKDIIKVSNSDLAERFQYVKKISQEPEILNGILNVWLGYFREILLSAVAKNQKPLFSKTANILRAIQKINFLISTTNINPRLALEILMLEF